MFAFSKNRLMDENTGTNQGGGQQGQQGGQGPQPGNANQGSQQGNNSGNENNSPFSLNPFADPSTMNGNGGQQTGQNQPQPNPGQQPNVNPGSQGSGQQTAPTANEQFNTFIQSLDLTAGLDTQALQSVIAGDAENPGEVLQSAFGTIAANTFRQAMVHSNQLMERRIAKAVQEAVSQSGESVKNDFAWQQLKEQAPFVAEPAVEPQIRAVLDGFLGQKNVTVQDAVTNTLKYMREQATLMGQHFEIVPPAPTPGSQPFGVGGYPANANPHNNSKPPTPDYLEILTGIKQGGSS